MLVWKVDVVNMASVSTFSTDMSSLQHVHVMMVWDTVYEYLPKTTEYITWTNALQNRCYMCNQ